NGNNRRAEGHLARQRAGAGLRLVLIFPLPWGKGDAPLGLAFRKPRVNSACRSGISEVIKSSESPSPRPSPLRGEGAQAPCVPHIISAAAVREATSRLRRCRRAPRDVGSRPPGF